MQNEKAIKDTRNWIVLEFRSGSGITKGIFLMEYYAFPKIFFDIVRHKMKK